MINRVDAFAKAVGRIWFLLVLVTGCSTTGPPQPDLVILISIDTLRADHLQCYGYQDPTSPTVSRLCGEGFVFRRGRAHAPSTLLSHASLLTSQLPQVHRASHARRLPLGPDAVTLAEVFAASDWQTVAITGGGQLAPEFGLSQGFSVYEQVGQDFDLTIDQFFHHLDQQQADGGHSPSFWFLHSYEVHHPYEPASEFLEAFRFDYSGSLPDGISVELLKQINWGGRDFDNEDLRFITSVYDAEIRSMDAALERLLAGLEDRELLDRALLILTSDHGEEFGEHGLVGWHAVTVHEELLRVPMIFHGPGVSAGASDLVVGSIDLAPTILELCGIDIPASFHGRSLRPVMRGRRLPPRPHIALGEVVGKPPFSSIQHGRWKWIEGRLFDLDNDPGETRDLAPAHPELTLQLQSLLEATTASPLPAAFEQPVSLDRRTVEQLESLGYL